MLIVKGRNSQDKVVRDVHTASQIEANDYQKAWELAGLTVTVEDDCLTSNSTKVFPLM